MLFVIDDAQGVDVDMYVLCGVLLVELADIFFCGDVACGVVGDGGIGIFWQQVAGPLGESGGLLCGVFDAFDGGTYFFEVGRELFFEDASEVACGFVGCAFGAPSLFFVPVLELSFVAFRFDFFGHGNNFWAKVIDADAVARDRLYNLSDCGGSGLVFL